MGAARSTTRRGREVLPPRDAQVLATLTVLSWLIVPAAMHAAAHPRTLGVLPAWLSPPSLALAAAIGGVVLAHGAWWARAARGGSRAMMTLASVVVLVASALASDWTPLGALGLGAMTLTLWSWLWGWVRTPALEPRATTARCTRRTVRGAFTGAAVVWISQIMSDAQPLASGWAMSGALVSASWLMRVTQSPKGPWWQRALTIAALIASPLCALPDDAARLYALPIVLALGVVAWTTHPDVEEDDDELLSEGGWLDAMLFDPARALIVTFAIGGLIGGLLLALPVADGRGGHGLPLLDAMFTSFSAICVTGLAVLDTPKDFSRAGQALILTLIQIGGLGIMTFSAAALALLGRRLSVRHEATVAALIKSSDRARMVGVLQHIFAVTFLTEGLGALVLTLLFWWGGDAPGEALWRGVFTSISAFCNAGFALQSDSLVSYQQQPLVLMTIAAIIVMGGLGPAVVVEAMDWPQRRRLSVQTRLVLITSAALTIVGFVFFAAIEWTHTLGGMGRVDRLANALFQSVTLRTAGFNSIDLAAVHPATYTLMLPLMFVGGSPGSTAGGTKTTTIAVLALLVRASFRGAQRTTFGGFALGEKTVYEAAAVISGGLAAIFVVVMLLLLTHSMTLDVALFEVVSALATVGLSIGGTAQLDEVGKIVIMAAMFAGRVGPLTLLVVLLRRHALTHDPPRPDVDVDVG